VRPIGSTETSVLNHPALSNDPEDGRIQFNRGETHNLSGYRFPILTFLCVFPEKTSVLVFDKPYITCDFISGTDTYSSEFILSVWTRKFVRIIQFQTLNALLGQFALPILTVL
jgi:hypothetical protein